MGWQVLHCYVHEPAQLGVNSSMFELSLSMLTQTMLMFHSQDGEVALKVNKLMITQQL